LSRAEYDRLHEIISRRFPEHLAEFVVSVHTGMRLSEKNTVQWKQFHRDRKTIELTDTKNGDSRIVHLNETALAAIESVRPRRNRPI
jgi:integrase